MVGWICQHGFEPTVEGGPADAVGGFGVLVLAARAECVLGHGVGVLECDGGWVEVVCGVCMVGPGCVLLLENI